MSAGHLHAGPIDADRARELKTLLDNPEFAAAVQAYTQEDDDHDIPYVGGSLTDWRTVCWDQRFIQAVKAGQFKIAGESEDPRPTGKVHEAVEGAIIHLWPLVVKLLGLDNPNGPKYPRAHDIATVAEQQAVAHKGWDWNAYQEAWKPWVRIDESETITNPPPNLLLEPYRGTKLYERLAGFQKPSSGLPPSSPSSSPQAPSSPASASPSIPAATSKTERQVMPNTRSVPGPNNAQPQPQGAGAKLSHAAVHYGMAKPGGDKCAMCSHFKGKDNCDLVEPPIYPAGWCDKFESKADEAAEHGGTPMAPNMPAPEQEQAEDEPSIGNPTLAHGRAIAGAIALHAVGHISPKERDKHVAASRAVIDKAKQRKPFGSWAQ